MESRINFCIVDYNGANVALLNYEDVQYILKEFIKAGCSEHDAIQEALKYLHGCIFGDKNDE